MKNEFHPLSSLYKFHKSVRAQKCWGPTPSEMSGRSDDLLAKMASCWNSQGRNASRNLTTLIYNSGSALDIEISYVKVTCRKKRPRPHDIRVHWPVVSMKSWCQFVFKNHPCLLLGGAGYENRAAWESTFETFWSRYRTIRPNHCLFSSGKPLRRCIPFVTHGDEGVTHRRVPFMVQSWQPVVSYKGTAFTAVSGSHAVDSKKAFFSSLCRIIFVD